MIPFTFVTPAEIELLRLKMAWSGRIAFSQVNFSDLDLEIDRDGEEIVARSYLQTDERESFFQFRRKKRRVEWLAGRVAAKHAALSLLGEDKLQLNRNWPSCHIVTKTSGRPYITSGNNPPDISISHSGPTAVAMACSVGRCGIDLQGISEKIFCVKEKFAADTEISLYQQNSHAISVDFGEFLTLLWSAKEALRKGINIMPIAGFLELQLQEISGDRANGIVFTFIFARHHKRGEHTTFQTYQILAGSSALAFFLWDSHGL